MRALPLLMIPVLLAGCASGPAQPVDIRLSPSMLQVRMSDGSFCDGPAPASGAELGWSGSFTGCPWAYDYALQIDPGTNPVRFVAEAIANAAGGEITPVADIVITRPDGRSFRFVAPGSRDRTGD